MHTVVNASSSKVKFRSDSLSTVYTRVCVREIYLRFTLIYMWYFSKIFYFSLFVENIFYNLNPILVYVDEIKLCIDRSLISLKNNRIRALHRQKPQKAMRLGISARNSNRFFCIECQPMRQIRSYSFSGDRNERRLISYWTIKGATRDVSGKRQEDSKGRTRRVKDEGREQSEEKKKEKVLSRATTKDFLNLV